MYKILIAQVIRWGPSVTDYIEEMVSLCNETYNTNHTIEWRGVDGKFSILYWMSSGQHIPTSYVFVDGYRVVQGLSHIDGVSRAIEWFLTTLPIRTEKI